MIKNYLVTSFRNLRRNWNFTVINIIGLSLGIGCCLLIFFTVRYELSYDMHHSHINKLYRLVRYVQQQGEDGYNVGASLPAVDALPNDFPELKDDLTCTYGLRDVLVAAGEGADLKKFVEPMYSVAFVGPAYFKMMDYKWLRGSVDAALTTPGTVVLTEGQAMKFFGTADPIGKTIRVDNKMNFAVTGVVADPPATTNFPFTAMLSFASLKDYGAFTSWDDWQSSYGGGQIYLRLPESVTQQQFEKRLIGFNKKYLTAEAAASESLILQPVKDLHFSTKTQNYSGRSIARGMIWSMVLVGVFILITACINFINLATAQAMRRAKEVGVRKVLGSSRTQLLRQYFSETGIITLFSVLLGLLVAQVALPYVSDTLNIKSEGVLFITEPAVLVFLVVLAIITTILAGFYPAMIVSGYQPILALKGKLRSTGIGQHNLRRGLIVLQFAISQIVLIGTIVAYSQMRFFRTMDIGFNKEQILNLRIPERKAGQVETLAAKLESIPGITSMSFSAFTPMSRSNWQTVFQFENQEKFLDFNIVMRPADTAYVRTYGLKMLAGRMYLPADTMREFVVNEAFVAKMGFKTPQEIIGKQMMLGGGSVKLPIVGVVKNFNTYSLHHEIIPCVLTTQRANYTTIGLKLGANWNKDQIAKIEQAWSATFPDHLFKYTFLDETLDQFYEKESRFFSLFRLLTIIAIFIGCLGLYGVVAYMAETRMKEMGIRKAVGASAASIFGLFSTDFVKLVVVALIVASPVAWYAMDIWLQDFTYRVSVDWWIFVLSGLVAIVTALFSISFQSVRAALMDPVKALRSE
jgi:putative ABC transport system permease protein